MFEKYFGKKVEDRKIDFGKALELIVELEKKGAQPIEFVLNDAGKIITKGPSYKYIYETLTTFLAPYQFKHNKKLRGDVEIRYRKRVYPSSEKYRFDFQQIIDNLFSKNIKSTSGRLEIIYQYQK